MIEGGDTRKEKNAKRRYVKLWLGKYRKDKKDK